MKRLTILLALLVLLAAGFADDAFGKIIARASTGDFVSTWKTDNPGTSEDNQITLPLESTGTYDFVAYWGDGTFDEITAYNDAAVTHTYPAAGTYTVRIIGEINGWRFNNTGDKSKIIDISQWGDLLIGNSGGYFYGCDSLNVTATDVLDVSSVTTFAYAFRYCSSLTTLDVSSWDVSSVTTFSNAFRGCSSLTTLDVSNWDVSSVTSFNSAFRYCSSLTTLDVSSWQIPLVADMTNMLTGVEIDNYSTVLINFAAQSPALQDSVVWGAGSANKFDSTAVAAKAVLTDTHYWTITDGGEIVE